MVEGILGGNVPIEKYIAGAGLGALLSAAAGGLGITVGLGFYLPFSIVVAYGIGTVIRVISDIKMPESFSMETGIPVAAGLIVGDQIYASKLSA